MKRAYLADTSTQLGVPLSTIYNIIALGESEGLDGTLVKKVQSWKDTVFFAHTLPDTEEEKQIGMEYMPQTEMERR
jgi:hypothetical protein